MKTRTLAMLALLSITVAPAIASAQVKINQRIERNVSATMVRTVFERAPADPHSTVETRAAC